MKKRTRILVSPAGMAAIYHLTEVARTRFADRIEIHLCDINPAHLIAASPLAASFTQVSPFIACNHRQEIVQIIKEKSIDIYLPMMEQEMCNFPDHDPELFRFGVACVSLPKTSVAYFKDKRKLFRFLHSHRIPVPKEITSINERGLQYFLKPITGYGSKNARILEENEIARYRRIPSVLLQELCLGPEITIEVFHTKQYIQTICRERIETKGGVCMKARLFSDSELSDLAKQVCGVLQLPPALCIQVMKNRRNEWVVTDVNPRMGAGTSMASACGWSLAGAFLSHLIGSDPDCWLIPPEQSLFILRTYADIVMKK